jgi:hypothetical protein
MPDLSSASYFLADLANHTDKALAAEVFIAISDLMPTQALRSALDDAYDALALA